MLATLSDRSGQFVVSAFEDDACAALEAAAKASACALLTVELDRRAGDELPRVTVRKLEPLEALARRTRLQLNIRVDDVALVERIAGELAPARGGGTGLVRLLVPLEAGGEAAIIAGRDFRLDGELVARIERIAGDGSAELAAQEPPRLALVG
jgi:DNA polymerase-3 subunit alpha